VIVRQIVVPCEAQRYCALVAFLIVCGCSASGGALGANPGAPALAIATPVPAPQASSAPASFPSASATALAKSAKRGIAYDLAASADLAALAPGVSWWYNWASRPSSAVPADYATRYGMDYYPMLWNGNFDENAVVTFLVAHPRIKYMLVLNEPNITGQANTTPQRAAELWPRYESVAARAGVAIVGPAITWGTMPNYQDPVRWLDAFYGAYRSANGSHEPRIDYLAFHWYDYGLGAQLDRLAKYGKPFWVTEYANWHAQNDGAQIDTLAKQEAQMRSMVATCENRSDVFRYAWFTGRVSPDPHVDSLLGTQGRLTELGSFYLALPHA